MDRTILHCDLNNFYASVACMDRPDLIGKPVAVCGDPDTRHGIILAKNYEAKQFGVTTASPVWEALQKCPDLVLLPPTFDKYMHYSRQVRDIYLGFTDQVEPFGIDECWLDVTGSKLLFGSGVDIARQIISKVYHQCGLTISVGVSFCKTFAKLGSDLVGKGEYCRIGREDFKTGLYHRPVCLLLGVGKSTQIALEKMGIFTIGDLAGADLARVQAKLGKNAVPLLAIARGEECDPVRTAQQIQAIKSVGNSVTLTKNVATFEELWPVFLHLSEKCAGRMRALGVMAQGVGITIKDLDLQVKQLQAPMPVATYGGQALAQFAFRMALDRYQLTKPVRAVGVRGISLVPAQRPTQLSLFLDDVAVRKGEKLDLVRDDLSKRYGKNVVTRCGLMNLEPLPEEKSGADELQVFGKRL